jgi:hypothetical protein
MDNVFPEIMLVMEMTIVKTAATSEIAVWILE